MPGSTSPPPLRLLGDDAPVPPIRLASEPQPIPLTTLIAEVPSRVAWRPHRTAIARRWAPGDAARCGLCPTCSAVGDTCLVVAARPVSESEAPSYRLRG